MITIYSTQICPRCKQLKALLKQLNIPYQEASLDDPGVLAEMRCCGFFGVMAPVIENSTGYHGSEEFFDGDELDEKKLQELIK